MTYYMYLYTILTSFVTSLFQNQMGTYIEFILFYNFLIIKVIEKLNI